MRDKKADFMQWPVTALLLIFPVVALVIHNAGNAILLLMLLLSLLALALRWYPHNIRFGTIWKDYWPLHLAMLSACIAVFLNQLWHGSFAFKYYDRGFRLAVFPLLFWLLFFVPARHLKLLQWSFFVATVLATMKAYLFTEAGHIRITNIGYLSIIAYSDIVLLTGVLSLLAIGWNKSKSKLVWALSLMACVVGTYTSMLTATRGSLLAIPLFVAFFFGTTRMSPKYKCIYVGAIIAALVLMFSFNDAARSRFLHTRTDLETYSQEAGKVTSTGIRLQLWGAALKLFSQQPVFGIGRENYEPAIADMARKNEVSKELVELAHSHNEILFNMVIAGIFGLISILATYLVPGYFFAKELKHPSINVQTAAKMGCVVVIGFFAFGLTDLMFFWPALGGYYSLLVASLLVYVIKEKRETVTATSSPISSQ